MVGFAVAGIVIGIAGAVIGFINSYNATKDAEELRKDLSAKQKNDPQKLTSIDGTPLITFYGYEEIAGSLIFAIYHPCENNVFTDVSGQFAVPAPDLSNTCAMLLVPCLGEIDQPAGYQNEYYRIKLLYNHVLWAYSEARTHPPANPVGDGWDFHWLFWPGTSSPYAVTCRNWSTYGMTGLKNDPTHSTGFFPDTDETITPTVPPVYCRWEPSIITRPGLVQFWIENVPLGQGKVLPNISMYLRRTVIPAYFPTGYTLPAGYSYSFAENPASVIYDILTNPLLLGISTGLINKPSFTTASEIFLAHDYGLSFVIAESVSAMEILAKIEELCFCVLYIDNNGLYCIHALDDADAATYFMVDDDFIDFQLDRAGWDSTFNVYKAKAIERPGALLGLMKPVELSLVNEANMLMTGSERRKDVDLTWFYSLASATKRLTEIMKKESMLRSMLTITVDRRWVEPIRGDVIHITNTELGISGNFRVRTKDIGKIDDNKISYTLIQQSDTLDSNYSDAQDSQGVQMDAPARIAQETVTFPAFTGTSTVKIVPIVTAANAHAQWGAGQQRTGFLTYGTDFTLNPAKDQVILDPTLYADDIQANALGFLNLDIWEE